MPSFENPENSGHLMEAKPKHLFVKPVKAKTAPPPEEVFDFTNFMPQDPDVNTVSMLEESRSYESDPEEAQTDRD